ncbi:MAG TPA: type II toxin-antitoxin system RelE/ParE family toxin [Acidobacteriaceae bacterium]|nr:type II toxin-antitoxin system RelE/ParE family toxin [Acidobacteriaceae bacterium]
MPPLKWSRAALADVSRLRDFLASSSPDAARRAASAIRTGVRELSRHPEIGRPAAEMPAEFREWIIPIGHGAYVVLYRFDGHEVVLLAVRHGREAGYQD